MNKKIAKKLLVLAKEVLSSTLSEWKKFIDFIEKEFPNAKVNVTKQKAGSAIWEYKLNIDGVSAFKLEERGWDERKTYTLTHAPRESFKTYIYQEKEVSFGDFKKEFEIWKNENTELVSRFNLNGISEEKGKELEKAVDDAIRTVIRLIKGYDVREIYFGNEGDKTVSANPHVTLSNNPHHVFLELNYNVKANRFKIWVIGVSRGRYMKVDNVDDYIKKLKNIGDIFLRGVDKLGYLASD
jgi:hypothetical protein